MLVRGKTKPLAGWRVQTEKKMGTLEFWWWWAMLVGCWVWFFLLPPMLICALFAMLPDELLSLSNVMCYLFLSSIQCCFLVFPPFFLFVDDFLKFFCSFTVIITWFLHWLHLIFFKKICKRCYSTFILQFELTLVWFCSILFS